MIRFLLAGICLSLVITVSAPVTAAADTEQISVRPIYQKTPVWCWAAAGEMALKYLGLPNLNPAGDYQCGIVGALGGACAYNCGMCITRIGSTFDLASVLNRYQDVARQYGYLGEFYRATPRGRLDFDDIREEINNGWPILAGISPSGMGSYYPPGMSEHVVVIVGYDDNPPRSVFVNDPMPYGRLGIDPYRSVGGIHLSQGRYRVSYEAFVRGLAYKDSILFF